MPDAYNIKQKTGLLFRRSVCYPFLLASYSISVTRSVSSSTRKWISKPAKAIP